MCLDCDLRLLQPPVLHGSLDLRFLELLPETELLGSSVAVWKSSKMPEGAME